MNCWKCNKQIPYGVECEECATGGIKFVQHPQKGEWLEIDWSKIVNIEDIKMVLAAINIRIRKDERDLTYRKLKKYLKIPFKDEKN